MVALIALVPAAIVLIVSFWTDSKGWTIVATVLMAALGALTGNPVFALLDILVVVGAYVLAVHLLNDRHAHAFNAKNAVAAAKRTVDFAAADAYRAQLRAEIAAGTLPPIKSSPIKALKPEQTSEVTDLRRDVI